jgi:cellulose synthase/poly-beta-1,6-N-acetylglucosamine synthase-like glycosyltransferase
VGGRGGERTRTRRNIALANQLAASPVVSVIVPAFNEALTIVESVRALLALDYESRGNRRRQRRIVDATLAVLQRRFTCWRTVAFDRPLPTEPCAASTGRSTNPPLS